MPLLCANAAEAVKMYNNRKIYNLDPAELPAKLIELMRFYQSKKNEIEYGETK